MHYSFLFDYIRIFLFWKNILPVALTAVGTCSSAASVPINISCTKKIGVPNDILGRVRTTTDGKYDLGAYQHEIFPED